MTRRILDAVTRVLTTTTPTEQPHFHQGAQGNIAACHASGCDRPQLQV